MLPCSQPYRSAKHFSSPVALPRTVHKLGRTRSTSTSNYQRRASPPSCPLRRPDHRGPSYAAVEAICRHRKPHVKLEKPSSASKMTGGRGGGGGRRILLPPINFIFKLLQTHAPVQIWLYEQLGIRIEGKIRVSTR